MGSPRGSVENSLRGDEKIERLTDPNKTIIPTITDFDSFDYARVYERLKEIENEMEEAEHESCKLSCEEWDEIITRVRKTYFDVVAMMNKRAKTYLVGDKFSEEQIQFFEMLAYANHVVKELMQG